MKINYENAINIMSQGNEELRSLIDNVFKNLPPVIIDKINHGITEGEGFKKKHKWEYKDNGEYFHLFITESNELYPKDCLALTLSSLPKRKLQDWPDNEGEKNIGSLTIYLYNKEKYNIQKLKVVYNFHLRVFEGRYVVNVTTDCNTSSTVDREIIKTNGFEEFHKNMIGLNYIADVYSITGEDRTKRNKMKII